MNASPPTPSATISRTPPSDHWLLCLAGFLIFFTIYYLSPVRQVYDSKYSILLSEAIYKHHSFDLGPFLTTAPGPLPYQLHRVGQRIYYTYPPGSSILSIPLVMALNAVGVAAISPDGHWNPVAEARIQRWIAALLTALTAALLLHLALCYLPPGPAIAVAITLGLGTSLWSTTSRALWSQTWQTLLLTVVLVIASSTAPRLRKSFWTPILLATLLSWMYFVRPTSAISIGAITIYMLWRNPRHATLMIAAAIPWTIAFLTFSLHFYNAWLPPYFQSAGGFNPSQLLAPALAQWISPSRGILVFSPWLLIVTFLLMKRWRHLPHKPLIVIALAAITLHWVLISAWGMWWFGHSYGPRAFLDMIPWFGLLTIFAWAPDNAESPAYRPSPAKCITASVLVLTGVFFHGVGAISQSAIRWNVIPDNIDSHPERVWDWTDPQFFPKTRRPPGVAKPPPAAPLPSKVPL